MCLNTSIQNVIIIIIMSLDLPYTLKPLNSRELPLVRDLHSKLLPVRYPPSFFLQLLVLKTRTCFVAYSNKSPTVPIGFVSAAIQANAATNCFTPDLKSTLSNEIHPISEKHTIDLLIHNSLHHIEVLTLGIHPTHQGKGLARMLIQRVINHFRGSFPEQETTGTLICANVSISNSSALRFYQSMGMSISPRIFHNLYRTISQGSKDAYLVFGILK
ncbi:hypothetical protein BJ165DRAFT_1465373, partial [Panaeolus papilionaceus]